MRLDLAFDCPVAEAPGDGLCRDVGRFGEPGCVPRLDLVPQRRPLTIGDGGNPRRRRAAAGRNGHDVGRSVESALREIARDRPMVMIAVRRPRQETRRILREDCRHRLCHRVGEFVLFDPIPDIEDEDAVRTEHASRLRKCLRLIGKEHRAELADDGVELSVPKGKLHRVCLPPLHRTPDAGRDRLIDHRLIQIGGDDRDAFGQRGRQGSRHHAGAGGDLEHAPQRPRSQATREVIGVRLENHRHQMRFVELRNRSGEDFVGRVVGHESNREGVLRSIRRN